jgi:hypothetical protein
MGFEDSPHPTLATLADLAPQAALRSVAPKSGQPRVLGATDLGSVRSVLLCLIVQCSITNWYHMLSRTHETGHHYGNRR